MTTKLTREDCADIRRMYFDRTKKETTGTLARLFHVSTVIINKVIDNRYTPLEDRDRKSPTKAARKTIVAIELTCPTCGDTIPAPGGSLFWEVAECGPQNTDKCYCRHCDQQLKFPKGI